MFAALCCHTNCIWNNACCVSYWCSTEIVKIITNSIKQSFSHEANSFSATQEILFMLYSQNSHRHVTNSLPLTWHCVTYFRVELLAQPVGSAHKGCVQMLIHYIRSYWQYLEAMLGKNNCNKQTTESKCPHYAAGIKSYIQRVYTKTALNNTCLLTVLPQKDWYYYTLQLLSAYLSTFKFSIHITKDSRFFKIHVQLFQ